VLYSGDPTTFGSPSDPFVGKSLGGVITFGGGLALYDGKSVVGGLGVSGDTSCADHNRWSSPLSLEASRRACP
jgi:Haem-degrading